MIKALKLEGQKVEVSDDGEVFCNGERRRQSVVSHGYKRVTIEGHPYMVHRLVAMAFIRELNYRDKSIHVHHIDGNKTNNNLSNLQVLTSEEHNAIHKWKYPKVKECVICGKKFAPCPSKRKTGQVCSNECKMKLDKIHASKRKRPINQLTKDGGLLKLWDSARDVQNDLGFYESNINKCCNGKIRSAYGYVWRYAEL